MRPSRIISIIIETLFPRNKNRREYNRETLEYVLQKAKRAVADDVLEKTSCISVFSYQDTVVRNAIHAFKYERETWIATVFAQSIADILTEEMADKNIFGTFTHPILIPIPIHRSKKIQRGFNQTELIAKALVPVLPIPIALETNILFREKSKQSQTRAGSKQERIKNSAGVFFIKHPEKVIGKDIILLDDVITTGATMREAQQILFEAGARNIIGVTVAH